MSSKEIFTKIYSRRKWGKNVPSSGEGTSERAVGQYLEFLKHVLSQHQEIRTILDIGHGDWEMWPEGFFQSYQYCGIDVVSELSNHLNLVHGNETTKFIGADFLETELPESDLLLIKDVLIHLSNRDIQRAIEIFPKYSYIVTVTDIQSSGYRVFFGCLYKSLKKFKGGAFIQLIKAPIDFINSILDSDISTGDYHWVRLHDSKWRLFTKDLEIAAIKTFEISGITRGRKVTKEITFFKRKRV